MTVTAGERTDDAAAHAAGAEAKHDRGPLTPLLLTATTVPLAVTGVALTGARLAGSDLVFPCSMDALFGLACPVCGCWRAATAIASGDMAGIADQWTAALVVGALALAAVGSALAALRRRLPAPRFAVAMFVAIGVTMLANLMFQLVRVTG